jgi:hypothetical protein
LHPSALPAASGFAVTTFTPSATPSGCWKTIENLNVRPAGNGFRTSNRIKHLPLAAPSAVL